VSFSNPIPPAEILPYRLAALDSNPVNQCSGATPASAHFTGSPWLANEEAPLRLAPAHRKIGCSNDATSFTAQREYPTFFTSPHSPHLPSPPPKPCPNKHKIVCSHPIISELTSFIPCSVPFVLFYCALLHSKACPHPPRTVIIHPRYTFHASQPSSLEIDTQKMVVAIDC
jgi:hypothetical protein